MKCIAKARSTFPCLKAFLDSNVSDTLKFHLSLSPFPYCISKKKYTVFLSTFLATPVLSMRIALGGGPQDSILGLCSSTFPHFSWVTPLHVPISAHMLARSSFGAYSSHCALSCGVIEFLKQEHSQVECFISTSFSQTPQNENNQQW